MTELNQAGFTAACNAWYPWGTISSQVERICRAYVEAAAKDAEQKKEASK